MAIDPKMFFDCLRSIGVNFYTGVPDSLLKQLCLCFDDNLSKEQHIIAANEGNAVAMAAGNHLAAESVPLVYMQNSGIGNAVNPLLSLCDTEVYSIPMLMLIGWRGEPGVKDEPQHIKQGAVQNDLLKSIDVPYTIISEGSRDYIKIIKASIEKAKEEQKPVAIIVKKGTFSKYGDAKKETVDNSLMAREEALEIILRFIPENAVIVSTTGKTSREIFELREKLNQGHNKDFMTVGSMGHCSSIALGIALSRKEKKVICIDGDGSVLMHMGSTATIGNVKPSNFYHILLNNKVHESVGGQATSANTVNFKDLAYNVGYSSSISISGTDELEESLGLFYNSLAPAFLEINIKPGSRDNLGRPTLEPIENKINFMASIKG